MSSHRNDVIFDNTCQERPRGRPHALVWPWDASRSGFSSVIESMESIESIASSRRWSRLSLSSSQQSLLAMTYKDFFNTLLVYLVGCGAGFVVLPDGQVSRSPLL